jgi:hypothetical protein
VQREVNVFQFENAFIKQVSSKYAARDITGIKDIHVQ